MKRVIITLGFIVLTIGIIIFPGCSKYEEGPLFSLRSKKSRIVGEWKATDFTVNEENYLSSSTTATLHCLSGDMFNYIVTGNMNFDWNFEKDGKGNVIVSSEISTLDFPNSFTQCTPIYMVASDIENEEVTWEISSDKEDIEITYNDGYKEIWNIIALREKEMKLSMTDDTGVHEITFEKR